MSQSKHWLWTLDVHDTQKDLGTFLEEVSHNAKVEYILAGEEIGPANGRRHFQGMVSVRSRMRMRTVKDLFCDDRVHIGDENGKPIRNLIAAIEYCKKDGNWVEFGTVPNIAESAPISKRWERARELCKEGKVLSIFDENPEFIRYQDHLYKYAAKLSRPQPRNVLENYWIYGPTGSGKSLYVREREGDLLYVVNDLSRFMWQDYDVSKHQAVLFDDMRLEDIKGHCKLMKNILDHYPFSAEMKGSSHGFIRPLRVYVTSLLQPEACVPPDHLDEFIRRLTVLSIDEFKPQPQNPPSLPSQAG